LRSAIHGYTPRIKYKSIPIRKLRTSRRNLS
jgi:hypothetical protein